MDHLVHLETTCLESRVATQVTNPCTSGIRPFMFGPHYSGLFDELVDLIEWISYDSYNCLVCKIMFISPNVPFNKMQKSESTPGLVQLKTFLHKPLCVNHNS